MRSTVSLLSVDSGVVARYSELEDDVVDDPHEPKEASCEPPEDEIHERDPTGELLKLIHAA
jgi:hypothetical protein